MSFPRHLSRILITLVGFAVFVMLAAGSEDDDPSPVLPPSPESVGHQNAMAWATENSTDLATKIQELETERSHAQSEIHRLESLKDQFPGQAGKITKTISEWQKVAIEIDSALAEVKKEISDAYVANQVEGEDQAAVLGRVYEDWQPKAARAIALAQQQRAQS